MRFSLKAQVFIRFLVPIFKKVTKRVCSNYHGITLLSLTGKIYSRVRWTVEPLIVDEQRNFRPGHGTMTVFKVLEGSWEFAQPVHMSFVDLCPEVSAGGHRVPMLMESESAMCFLIFLQGHILNKSFGFLFPPAPATHTADAWLTTRYKVRRF